jgi:hypothetical protein
MKKVYFNGSITEYQIKEFIWDWTGDSNIIFVEKLRDADIYFAPKDSKILEGVLADELMNDKRIYSYHFRPFGEIPVFIREK